MRGVTPANWKLVGMAIFTPAIGNVVYEATFDATESSGRMEQRGRGSRREEKHRDVNQTAITKISAEAGLNESALRIVLHPLVLKCSR